MKVFQAFLSLVRSVQREKKSIKIFKTLSSQALRFASCKKGKFGQINIFL